MGLRARRRRRERRRSFASRHPERPRTQRPATAPLKSAHRHRTQRPNSAPPRSARRRRLSATPTRRRLSATATPNPNWACLPRSGRGSAPSRSPPVRAPHSRPGTVPSRPRRPPPTGPPRKPRPPTRRTSPSRTSKALPSPPCPRFSVRGSVLPSPPGLRPSGPNPRVSAPSPTVGGSATRRSGRSRAARLLADGRLRRRAGTSGHRLMLAGPRLFWRVARQGRRPARLVCRRTGRGSTRLVRDPRLRRRDLTACQLRRRRPSTAHRPDLVSSGTPPPARRCGSTSTPRPPERPSARGSLGLPPSRRVTPYTGTRSPRHPNRPRDLRHLRWTLCHPARRGAPQPFPRPMPRPGTWTRRHPGRRSAGPGGTCSGMWTPRCSRPPSGLWRQSGIRWRCQGPRSRYGGRCRDPRCGEGDPATGMTGPTAGAGGGSRGRPLPSRRPRPGRGGAGSGWRP